MRTKFLVDLLPDNFRLDSSPIVICKYINKIYNSNSTMKSELQFVQNNKFDRNKNFKVNILYQIKDIHRIKSNIFGSKSVNSFNSHEEKMDAFQFNRSSPISSEEHRPKTTLSHHPAILLKPDIVSWRNDFKKLYREFSIVKTPSYRVSTAKNTPPNFNDGQIITSNNLNPSEFGGKGSNLSMVPENKEVTSVKQSKAGHYLSVPHLNEQKNKSSSNSSAKLDIYLVPGTQRLTRK